VLIEVTDEYETGDLWVTDGTVAGTFLAATGGPSYSHYYGWNGTLSAGAANGRIVFSGQQTAEEAAGEVLLSSDGSPAGSRPILEARTPRGSHPYQLTPFRDGLLARTCAEGAVELRFVQGTETTLLESLEESYCAPFFSDPVVLGDVAVFFQFDGLWRTDGTPEGTKLLIPSTGESAPYGLAPFGHEAAVAVSLRTGDTNRTELWLTDGTAAGTRKQVELPAGTDAIGLAAAGGRLWFFDMLFLADNETALRPWVSDGTPAGTRAVTTRYGHVPEVGPTPFVEAGGRVYFLFAELPNKIEIWGSDGTPAGTGPAVTRESGAGEINDLAAIGDRRWFTAPRLDDLRGRLLPWISDGTDAGTELLAELDMQGNPDFALPDRPPFVELDGRVFFAAAEPGHGEELWSSDGTPGGVALVRDIAPGFLGSYPRELTVWNGKLWFRALDGAHGMELWSSDGTAEGTMLVQDIAPGAAWSAPAELTGTEDGLYFSAHDREHGRELWVVP
jgi:ELWxxDGT repeat protein